MVWAKLHSEVIFSKEMREHPKTRLAYVDYVMLAGIAKQDGALINPENHLPFTTAELAVICQCKEETIEEMNKILKQAGLIEIKNKVIHITNWDKCRDDYERQKPLRQKKLTEADQNSMKWLKEVFVPLYSHKDNMNEVYVPMYSRDLAHIKRMLKEIGWDKLTEAVNRFFKIRKTDKWLKDKGATVGMFISVINQVLTGKEKPVSPFAKE